jgi:hypothetical protein
MLAVTDWPGLGVERDPPTARPSHRSARTAQARPDARGFSTTDLPPALLLFSIGLAWTVAPVTATVLPDAERRMQASHGASTTQSPGSQGCSRSQL